jgi:4-amino-4-deoxy-L-arabinose transferase-like glycosyltransferase
MSRPLSRPTFFVAADPSATVGGSEAILARLAPWHGTLIVLVALAIRLPIVLALDTVTTGWHSADYASIARNYYVNGFQFLYPQVDWGGDGPGYVEMEFPLLPYLAALSYLVAGGVDDRLTVIWPLLGGMFAVWFTYLVARELFTQAEAFMAGLVVAISPVFVRFSQLFFPEASLLACSAASIYFAVRWLNGGGTGLLVASALSTSLAILLKPTALILGGPLLWIFFLSGGWRVCMRPHIYWFAALALVPAFWWYYHALQLAIVYGNSFGVLFGGGSTKLAALDLVFTVDFYTRLAVRLVVYHLMILPIVGLVWSLVRYRFSRKQGIVLVWLGSAGASLLIAATGNYSVSYYQLPIVLPGAIVAAVGLLQLGRDVSRLGGTVWRLAFVPLLLLAGLAVGAAVGAHEHYKRGDYVAGMIGRRDAARELSTALAPGSLIIFSEPSDEGLPRGQHVTPPDPFYFTGRRGWFLAFEWVSTNEIDRLVDAGARYFVTPSRDALRRQRPDILAFLDARGTPVASPSAFAAWELRAFDRSSP